LGLGSKKLFCICHLNKKIFLRKTFSQPTVLIWDSDGEPPAGDWLTVLWRNYDTKGRNDVASIQFLVEDNAESLRTQYLKWIYRLGETKINGKRIVDHLEIRSGLSYWWMTLLAEKCNFAKSPQINDAIKLLAFDKWARGKRFKTLALTTSKAGLAKVLKFWCLKTGTNFQWQHIKEETGSVFLPIRLYQSMPHLAQACTLLVRHLIQGWSLRGVGLKEWRETKGKVTFISYFFNLVPEALKAERFESRYWAHLRDVLAREGCHTNWLQLYVKSAVFSAPMKAAEAIRGFNKTGKGAETHITLDSFLSGGVVLRALRDWFRLALVGLRLRKSLSFAINPLLDFTPLFQIDWDRSMAGQTAMNSVLYLNLIEEALKTLPKQRVGVYLQENQAWEFALIHAWRTAGHGRLIGAPHSSVRFWDLRYFFDPRSYKSTDQNTLPIPDQVAVNGPAMMKEYQRGRYPSAQLVEVEALRYLYLGKKTTAKRPTRKKSFGPLRVLVLGDYLPSNTHQMMLLLEKAFESLPADTTFVLKPHPNCPVRTEDYPSLRMSVTMGSVSTLFPDCNVAFSSAGTSAAVDAYCAGVPVISARDPKTLNLSPLRSRKGVHFVSTPEELKQAFDKTSKAQKSLNRKISMFQCDKSLRRWKKIFAKSTGRKRKKEHNLCAY